MKPLKQQTHVTEEYVSSPPALWVINSQNQVFTLSEQMGTIWNGNKVMGEFVFEVLMNGNRTGQFASRIEMRRGKVRIFTKSGWKHWTGRQFI